jgi:hypothetical protein
MSDYYTFEQRYTRAEDAIEKDINNLVEMKPINVNGMKITPASVYVLLAGIVLSIFLFCVMKKYALFISLFMLVIFSINSYTVNCVEVGNCSVWMWTLTAINIAYALLIGYSAVYRKLPYK